MRNEETMFKLLLDIAQKDDRIIAVYMNGSRTNPNVPKDIFQDYDVVYVVKDTKPFIGDKGWLDRFGTILYMQYPDENPDFPGDKENFLKVHGNDCMECSCCTFTCPAKRNMTQSFKKIKKAINDDRKKGAK